MRVYHRVFHPPLKPIDQLKSTASSLPVATLHLGRLRNQSTYTLEGQFSAEDESLLAKQLLLFMYIYDILHR